MIYIFGGLYYKHLKIVNDNSSIVGKWNFKLIDDARAIIYDCNILIIQATDHYPILVKDEYLASLLRIIYMKQPKSVRFLLSDWFCQAVCPIFVSIWLTDITLHKIRQRDRKIPISKSVGEPGKIGWTTWQNWLDVTKIGSTTVRVNRALVTKKKCFITLTTGMQPPTGGLSHRRSLSPGGNLIKLFSSQWMLHQNKLACLSPNTILNFM